MVGEIVERINGGEKVGDVAKSLNISQNTLSKRLRKNGYNYNQSTKRYEIVENVSEVSAEVRKKAEESSELILTEEEVKFIKNLYKKEKDFDPNFRINWERSKLPPKRPDKKVPYIISEKTFNEFKAFADVLEEEYRVTQNELVEMALRKFMREMR